MPDVKIPSLQIFYRMLQGAEAAEPLETNQMMAQAAVSHSDGQTGSRGPAASSTCVK
jgi:hypothetical protein